MNLLKGFLTTQPVTVNESKKTKKPQDGKRQSDHHIINIQVPQTLSNRKKQQPQSRNLDSGIKPQTCKNLHLNKFLFIPDEMGSGRTSIGDPRLSHKRISLQPPIPDLSLRDHSSAAKRRQSLLTLNQLSKAKLVKSPSKTRND